MGRCFKYVFASVVIWVSFLAVAQNSHATSAPLWQPDAIMKLAQETDDKYLGETHPCGGNEGVITLKHESTFKRACVFGTSESVQLARYVTRRGEFAYAVAFPNEPKFSHVNGLCPTLGQCVYGHASDTLLIQEGGAYPHYHATVKEFTKYLVRSPDDSTTYHFHHPSFLTYLKKGSTQLITGSATVSNDGRWILVELAEYGLLRIDAVSGEMRRIAARGTLPPSGGEITSFAISDDGRWVAAVGYRSGVYVFEVNNTCGDALTGFSSTTFGLETTPCRSVVVPANQFSPSAERLFAPRFSSNARQLTVHRREGPPVKVTLTQKGMGFWNPHYIAFGDSFTSGEGELEDHFYLPETNTSSNRCHVSTRSYPYLLESYWEFLATNLACSGSRIEGVQQASQEYDTSPARPPSAVSLSVGGNDADFIGKLKSCLGPRTCEWAQEKYRKATAIEIKNLFPRIVRLVQELKQSYSAAHMFMVGYPNSINAHPDARCSPVIGALLNDQERRYMSESIHYLNQVMEAAAKYTKIPFADIENAYGGERLCDNNATAMNGVRYGDDIAPVPFLETVKLIGSESFHPTPRGHYLTSLAIRSSITTSWESSACGEGCPFAETDLEIPSYWLEGEAPEPPPQLLSKKFMDSETYLGVPGALYKFVKRTFSPTSIVTFELHSEAKSLGQAVVLEDGSLTGKLTLPLDVEGYHTIHAFGASYSGEPIDIYQTIYIATSAESETDSKQKPDLSVVNTLNKQKNSEFTEEESRKIAYSPNEPTTKGVQVKATSLHPKNDTWYASVSPWYSWLGIGLVATSVPFLLWWIFFKKPKL